MQSCDKNNGTWNHLINSYRDSLCKSIHCCDVGRAAEAVLVAIWVGTGLQQGTHTVYVSVLNGDEQWWLGLDVCYVDFRPTPQQMPNTFWMTGCSETQTNQLYVSTILMFNYINEYFMIENNLLQGNVQILQTMLIHTIIALHILCMFRHQFQCIHMIFWNIGISKSYIHLQVFLRPFPFHNPSLSLGL